MFMSERHQEGLAHLLYGINIGGGFVALTGEVGTGKTTLCHCLLQQLPVNIDIALILNPKLNALELLATIRDELGIRDDGIPQTSKNLIDAINRYLLAAYANGRRTVLLIDEAQNLSLEVLEQIRLLTNLETSKAKLLQIILVGQPELQQLLKRQDLRQLNQRITARYHLLPLSFEETRAYIQHRLTVCNGDPRLFKERAIRKIYRYSSGIPRVINILCDRALLGAYANNLHSISAEVIDGAARETLELGNTKRWLKVLAVMLLVGGIAAGGYLVKRNPLAIDQPGRVLAAPSQPPQATADLGQAPPKPEPTLTAQPPKTEAKSFAVWLQDPALSINAAMLQALKVWQNPLPSDGGIDCDYIASLGLHCLSDNASWKDLLALDRPAILQFSLPPEQKRHALLIGVDKGQAIFLFDDDLRFPVADVLTLWDGHFLLFWRSPRSDTTIIAPLKISNNVAWLREQLSVGTGEAEDNTSPSLFFDDALKASVIEFQHRHHLLEDGIVGAQTLIHLDNQTGADTSPHLEITE